MLVCICTGLVGGIVYGASLANTCGYDSGFDYRFFSLKELKKWYVGDFEIFTHLVNPDGFKSEYAGKEYGGIKVGYRAYDVYGEKNYGLDYKLYEGFNLFKGKASCKLKEFIKEDGSGKLYSKTKTMPFSSKEDVKSNMVPLNCSLYHPLNVLRMLQIYSVTRSDKKFIGGWPVQVSRSDSNSYSIEGARSIKTVYKQFTGVDYIKPGGRGKDPLEGTNYAKGSIYDKLLKGNISFHEAYTQLLSKLKSANVTILDSEDLMQQGNLTYEEYLVVCLRGGLGVRVQSSEDSGFCKTPVTSRKDYNKNKTDEEQFIEDDKAVTDDSYFDNQVSSSSGKLKNYDEVKSRQLFYRTVFRYLEEYGIHFYSYNQANPSDGSETDKKSIFTATEGDRYNHIRYPQVGKKGGRVVTTNMAKKKDNPVSAAIAQELKSAYSEATGTKATKIRMFDIAQGIITAMKDACPEDDDINNYFSKDPDSALGTELDELYNGSKLDNETLNKVRDTAAKTAKGVNGLNKIDDTYVVKFFLNLCTQSGASGNNAVDIEYLKIMNILSRKNVKQGKQTLNDCFAMMYSLDNIGKCGKEYTETFKARDSSQISVILKYTETNMQRVWRYFREDKGDSNNDPIESYRNPELKSNKNAVQHYSDYAECSSAIKVMGAKVYRNVTGYDGEAAYEKFRDEYSNWLKNQKTGKTKNVKGVQQQDGLLPYALTDNTDELKDQSKGYFSEKANSPDGKNVLSKKEYTTNDAKSQEKIWKWQIDTDEFNEMLKTNFWVQLTNGLLAAVGLIMFVGVFAFSSVYAFDMVSNGYYNITHKITFGKWDYVDKRKENVKVLLRLCVAMYFSYLIWSGTAFYWVVNIMNTAYQALTTK